MQKRKHAPRAIGLIFDHFQDVDDPRIDRTKLHSLENVFVMSLCAVICGAKGWDAIADFAALNEEWFGEFLELPNRTPSADTIRRVFMGLDAEEFERSFRAWVAELGRDFTGEVVAIDGKSIRRAVDRARPTVPLHLVHVWATRQGLLLAAKAVDGAPGEVRAVQELVRSLDLRGAIVTADANSCTAATTQAICEAGADYVLALKGNRGPLHARVVALFDDAKRRRFRAVPTFEESGSGHGRIEQRVVHALPLPDDAVRAGSGWTGMRTAVHVVRTRRTKGVLQAEEHYYVSSLPQEPEKLARAIRAHWSVENELHWCLDVSFGEDDRRVRDANAAANLATLARIALILLKRTPTRRKGTSIVMRRRMAGWNRGFLGSVLLAGIPQV
jgi:predicted transposase YbfD/YdcC